MTTGDWSALISAISALLAFCFSIFVYIRTQRFVMPTERPVVELVENKCTGTLSDDRRFLQINMFFLFQNVGKHTASNLRIQIGLCPVNATHEFRNYVDTSAANDIRPGTKFNWDQRITLPVKVDGNVIELPRLELLLYVRVSYDDAWFPKRERYVDVFYLNYTVGHAAAAHATLAQREMIEKHAKRVYS